MACSGCRARGNISAAHFHSMLCTAPTLEAFAEQQAALVAELLDALKIAKVNTKHNRLNPTDQTHGCWITCSACVIDAAIARAEGTERSGE